MRPFWSSRAGKLVVGGCGTQIGMLVTFGGLLALLLLCSICLTVNFLAFGLRQTLAGPETTIASVEVNPSPSKEVTQLVGEINILLTEIEMLQANMPLAASLVEANAVPEAKPMVMASQNDVALRTGPGVDYEQSGLLPTSETFEIVGRSNDSSWWLISVPDGRFAWVANQRVTVSNLNNSIPVVMTPSQLGQPAASVPPEMPVQTPAPAPTPIPTRMLPPGTPTPTVDQEREYVEELSAYQRVKAALFIPPVSASISPDGSLIALTERIRLYTVTTAGAHTDIWLEDNAEQSPIGGAVWSPDGDYLAFVVGFKNPKCRPCRSVALLRMSDGLITYFEAPNGLDTDAPRWTQNGRLLINVHPGEPADGTAYVYDISGRGQEATGAYVLSSSHESQKWYPWLPGRIWRAGVTERADSYNSD